MIKLNLIAKPSDLTPAIQRQLTSEYNASQKAVWKKSYIESALLKMTNNKCAYSEQLLNRESAYMEIDHFKCKELYPNDVVVWGNLLPSCKKCNSTKGDHDVMAIPIVNPLIDYPKDSLYVKGFRYYSKNIKGQTTIDVLALNDRIHFAMPRAEVALKVADSLEEQFDSLKQATNTVQIRRAISKIKSLLLNCGPKYEYSAVVSTYILFEFPLYNTLESFMKVNSYWDEELDNIKNQLLSITLEES